MFVVAMEFDFHFMKPVSNLIHNLHAGVFYNLAKANLLLLFPVAKATGYYKNNLNNDENTCQFYLLILSAVFITSCCFFV